MDKNKIIQILIRHYSFSKEELDMIADKIISDYEFDSEDDIIELGDTVGYELLVR